MTKWIVTATLTAAALSAGCGQGNGIGPGQNPYVLKFELVREIDKAIPEPSGIVYHPGRGTLFVVSDEGGIYEIKTNGLPVGNSLGTPVPKRDYEGIAVDPTTGLLYVVVEGQDVVLEIDPDTFQRRREFAIPRQFGGRTVIAKGGQGLEGITFAPDPGHAEGGAFYVSNQAFSLEEDDVSAVFEVELPLRTSDSKKASGSIVTYFSLGVIDLSGLHYDQPRDRLYVISDATNTLWEVTTDGRIIAGYGLPGTSQEGIALDGNDNAYIAQDSGGVVKYKWLDRPPGK